MTEMDQCRINKEADRIIDAAVEGFRKAIVFQAYSLISSRATRKGKAIKVVTPLVAKKALENVLSICGTTPAAVVISTEWMKTPLEENADSPFSVRGGAVLRSLGCKTLGDVWDLRPDQVLNARNSGHATVCEIASILSRIAKRDWYAK